jgi:hypothetical protein
MGFTADNLVEALTVCTAGRSGDLSFEAEAGELYEIVLLLRHVQPTFVPTLYSAWQAEGRELSPLMRLELDAALARIDHFRSVDADVKARMPALDSVKGLEILDLYPSGICRHQGDLDYVAASEDDLWEACRYLLSAGWEMETATFSVADGDLQIIASLRQPNEDPYQMAYGIEITTFYSIGNYGAIKPLLKLRPQWSGTAIKNILMLLYERYEQAFRAKDLVDNVILHNELRGDELAVLHSAVVELCLGVEYAELIEMVGQTGLGPLPPWPGKQLANAAIRARRGARAAGHFLRPVAGAGRHLQRRMITGDLGSADAALWETVQQRLAVPKAMSGGLLAFGLPMDTEPPPVSRTMLRRRGKLAWADTPVGRFLLTIGDYVAESDVEDLTSMGLSKPADAALGPAT